MSRDDRVLAINFGFHEGKCCDAVLRWFEARLGVERAGLRSPEKEHDSAPVEITCRFGAQLYALEHTGVEPFDGHVRLQAEAERDFGPVYTGVANRLPAGDLFELHVPARAMQPLSRQERATVQAAIVGWVLRKAPSVVRSPVGRIASPVTRETPPGVPFELSLHRYAKPAGLDRDFSISHLVQSARAVEEREARVYQACARKFPKLAEWKARAGARTVLVLEDNDLQLSNPQVIYEALAAAERRLVDRPDEVHLGCIRVEPEWWHFRLRVDDLTYHQLEARRPNDSLRSRPADRPDGDVLASGHRLFGRAPVQRFGRLYSFAPPGARRTGIRLARDRR